MSKENENRHSVLLGEHMENYNVEASALHRKLQSKVEALKIMRTQLEKFRTERDQFKLMAETLQLRYSAIKKSADFSNINFNDDNSSVAILLNETREKNIRLSTEVEAVKQKLTELQGDMELLRNKNTITASGKNKNPNIHNPDKEENAWKLEKTSFIIHLENLKKKNAQLSFDLKNIIDEKEEAVTERDAYKCKTHRLNHELLAALKANESHKRIVDIDGLILENNYLQEKLKNYENELEIAQQSSNKYKTMLDTKRKKGIIKLGTNNIDNIMSHKQVKILLENSSDLPSKTETIADLKSLCLALLDNLNDKNVALNHQKRTNKILASKIAELEQRIQLICGKNDSVAFSPSQILLNDYCPSNVDYEPKSCNVTDDSGTMSSDESNKTSQLYDDGMESLSSDQSNRSIASSEYGNPEISSDISSMYTLGNLNNTTNTITKERIEDLKDLPPELAEMIYKALQDLDAKENE